MVNKGGRAPYGGLPATKESWLTRSQTTDQHSFFQTKSGRGATIELNKGDRPTCPARAFIVRRRPSNTAVNEPFGNELLT